MEVHARNILTRNPGGPRGGLTIDVRGWTQPEELRIPIEWTY